MYDLLIKLAPEFGMLVEEEKKNTELEVIGQLNKSVKLDEVDTVTFGLETDDGKIVKVYVKAEQAEDFEKALGEKLGEVDDIETALNQLAKDFEIVDVEWPDEAEPTNEPDTGVNDTGADVLNKDVYKNSKETAVMNKELAAEQLELGDELALSLMENTNTLESRFTTATQLMIYHTIIDLGIPEVALARNPYRAAIVRGIKDKANEMIQNSGLKSALKMFIKRSVDYDAQAKKHAEMEQPVDEVKAPALSGMPVVIAEESCDWSFSSADDKVSISCKHLTMELGDEELEKLIKGITNKDAVVVRDDEDRMQKFVFSPRGSSVLVKRVGSTDGYMMSSKDVDSLLSSITPEKPEGKEEE